MEKMINKSQVLLGENWLTLDTQKFTEVSFFFFQFFCSEFLTFHSAPIKLLATVRDIILHEFVGLVCILLLALKHWLTQPPHRPILPHFPQHSACERKTYKFKLQMLSLLVTEAGCAEVSEQCQWNKSVMWSCACSATIHQLYYIYLTG